MLALSFSRACSSAVIRKATLLSAISFAALLAPPAAVAWVSGNGHSSSGPRSMSGNGRYVAFVSGASDLVAGDTNGFNDIFVLDTMNDAVVRVSVDSSGVQANQQCQDPSINYDGTKIAFTSAATNLVAGDANAQQDVFVRDLTAGTTVRANVDSAGQEATGGPSGNPSLSADGTKIAFDSECANLVAGDLNGKYDVFVRDLAAGTTVRANVSSSEAEGNDFASYPSLSGDGTKVAFSGGSTNLVSGDANGVADVFVRDLAAGTTVRVSVHSSGAEGVGSGSGMPSISADGTKVAFESSFSNLAAGDINSSYDVFVHTLSTGATVIASVNTAGTIGNGSGLRPSLNGNGNRVVFHAPSTNLVAGDTNGRDDIFVRDILEGTTTRISLGVGSLVAGAQGDQNCRFPSISSDGTQIVFWSLSTNLADGDTNGFSDVFVRNVPLLPVTLSAFEVE